MKNFFTLLIVIVSLGEFVLAQDCKVNLQAFEQTASNKFKFRVYLVNTRGSAFSFAGGSWGFNFDKAILNSGTMTGTITASGIGSNHQPNNPTVNVSVTPGRLVFTAKAPGDGGPNVNNGDSLYIFEAEFTNSVTFASVGPSLAFRTASPQYTLIYRYASGNSGTQTALTYSNNVYYDNSPLPVELTAFSAVVREREVILKWRTATEINVKGFEVQRVKLDKDGVRPSAWEEVSFLKGSGNSNSPKDYTFTDIKLNTGKYEYRLKMIDNDGTFKLSDPVKAMVDAPIVFDMKPNYPNPFNPSTTIRFALPEHSRVELSVYNILGERIAMLADKYYEAGYHQIEWNAINIPSGVYFYKLTANNFVDIKKMLLVR